MGLAIVAATHHLLSAGALAMGPVPSAIRLGLHAGGMKAGLTYDGT